MSRPPIVSDPVAGAPFLGRPLSYDLAALGYSSEELFVEGTGIMFMFTGADEEQLRSLARGIK